MQQRLVMKNAKQNLYPRLIDQTGMGWKDKANRPVVIHWRFIDIDEFLMAY